MTTGVLTPEEQALSDRAYYRSLLPWPLSVIFFPVLEAEREREPEAGS
jgi:hypothetical protein